MAGSSDVLYKTNVYLFAIEQWRTKFYRAKSWELNNYLIIDLEVLAMGIKKCCLKLDVSSKLGKTKWAECIVNEYPGQSLIPCVDSKRYFVLNVKWNTGKTENVGICFMDRHESRQCMSLIQDFLKTDGHCPLNIVKKVEPFIDGIDKTAAMKLLPIAEVDIEDCKSSASSQDKSQTRGANSTKLVRDDSSSSLLQKLVSDESYDYLNPVLTKPEKTDACSDFAKAPRHVTFGSVDRCNFQVEKKFHVGIVSNVQTLNYSHENQDKSDKDEKPDLSKLIEQTAMAFKKISTDALSTVKVECANSHQGCDERNVGNSVTTSQRMEQLYKEIGQRKPTFMRIPMSTTTRVNVSE